MQIKETKFKNGKWIAFVEKTVRAKPRFISLIFQCSTFLIKQTKLWRTIPRLASCRFKNIITVQQKRPSLMNVCMRRHFVHRNSFDWKLIFQLKICPTMTKSIFVTFLISSLSINYTKEGASINI